MENERPFWNPYLAGVALGLVLLVSYVVMGFGLGASSAPTRVAVAAMHLVAADATEGNPYFSQYVKGGQNPLEDWMVFEVLGVLLGGVIGAYIAGRMKRGSVETGPNTTRRRRFVFAVLGGGLLGFAARLARGCTSGQALTGGAVLSLGSWVFMLAVFVGAYALAPVMRREWR